MNIDKYVFAQLVSFLDRSKFNRIVKKYDGDKYVKSFTCWNQLLVMIFAQLTKQDSLRTTSLTIESLRTMCYHLVKLIKLLFLAVILKKITQRCLPPSCKSIISNHQSVINNHQSVLRRSHFGREISL